MKTWRVIVEVQADDNQGAIEAATRFLNEGGEPVAVLSDAVDLSFPDPDPERWRFRVKI